MSTTNGAHADFTADDILALVDLEYQDVPVPEWGARLDPPRPDFTVRIRTLTIDELEQLIKDSTVPDRDKPGTFRRDATKADQLLFQLGVVRPAFTPAQVKQLWGHSAVPVGRVLAALNTLNRAGDTAEEVAGAVAAFPAESPAPAAV